MSRSPRLTHLLLGMAVGDSIGLPFEGLKAAKISRRLGEAPLRQCLLGRRGWISDDTETALLALAALRLSSDPGLDMARLLRRWFWGLPPGIGLATVRSCLKMTLLGARPHSGVHSAGNGGLMRAIVAGVWAAEQGGNARTLGEAVCLPTHTHPLAVDACRTLAHAACEAALGLDPRRAVEAALKEVESDDLHARLTKVLIWPLDQIGLPENPPGFSGYSLPLAFAHWIKHGPEVRKAVDEAVRLGGDTDSHAALAAGLCAVTASVQGTFDQHMPMDWLDGIADRPISPAFISEFADDPKAVRMPWFAMRLRNAALLAIILGHGFLRLVR